jgi:hypothetical protein
MNYEIFYKKRHKGIYMNPSIILIISFILVFFSNVANSNDLVPNATPAQENTKTSNLTPNQSMPSQKVGNLEFMVESWRGGTESQYIHKGVIWLSIKNDGIKPVSLNYVLGSAKIINEYGDTWQYGESLNGVGSASGNSANVLYIVQPGKVIHMNLGLTNSTIQQNQTNGTKFNFSATFSSYIDIGGGRLKKTHIYPVSIVGFHEGPDEASQNDQNNNSNSNQQDVLQKEAVDDLEFDVNSLQMSQDQGGSVFVSSFLTVYLTIKNNGSTPVSLNYLLNSGVMVNEFSELWFFKSISGVGLDTGTTTSLDYVIQPGDETKATIVFSNMPTQSNKSLGTNFNFSATFTSYVDTGGGRLKEVHIYPVSFIGLHKSSIMKSGIDDIKSVGSQLKNTFKNFFGN